MGAQSISSGLASKDFSQLLESNRDGPKQDRLQIVMTMMTFVTVTLSGWLKGCMQHGPNIRNKSVTYLL
jgi:hypothetical protein